MHAAIQKRLAEAGLYAQAQDAETTHTSPLDLIAEQIQKGLENAGLKALADEEKEQELWWLADGADGQAPLCDRVEMVARRVLKDKQELTELEFANEVHARFPAPLTPDAELVATCLRAYGQETSPDRWQLREEDAPAARRAERQSIVEQLLRLGLNLGYETSARHPFDVAWFQRYEERAVFVVRWHAALCEALTLAPLPPDATPYLVIPGGRAELASYKLRHNPLWQQIVDDAGWRFIKYRHVRQLAEQPEVDEYALRTIIGLDPIVERETAQIPLF
jgi:hypothetical protein